MTETTNLISEGPKFKTQHERPEKFKGIDFKTWQSKMLFYLTTLRLVRFLKEDVPTPKEGQTVEKNKEIFLAIEAWMNSNFLCRNYILNSQDEVLYKVYSPIKTSKLLWEALEKKYKIEDVGLKKFVVEKFMTFNIIDTKFVSDQIQEIQILLHEIVAEGHIGSVRFG